jgi:uncharacterized membrane protein YeiB
MTVSGRSSFMIYLSASILASIIFYFAASWRGASTTDSAIGSVWVFVLTVIVSMSVVPRFVKGRLSGAK